MPDFATLQQIDQGQFAPPPPVAGPASYPDVPAHPAPDGSGAYTNLSDADYAKFMAGVAPSLETAAPISAAPNGNPSTAAKADPLAKFRAADAAANTASVSKGAGDSPPSEPDQTAAGQGAPATSKSQIPPPSAPVAALSESQKPLTGLTANVGAGANEALAATAGAPVDLVTGALNLAPRAINAVAGTDLPTIKNPVGGSQWLESAMGLLGADPRTVQPAGPGEQLARAAAAGAVSAALPVGAAGQIARAGEAIGPVAEGVAKTLAQAPAAPTMLGGAVSGATGTAAADAAQESGVPSGYLPAINLAGQLAGGGVATLGAGAGMAALRGGRSALLAVGGAIPTGPARSFMDNSGAPIVDTTTGRPVVATTSQMGRTGATIARRAGMAPADLAASLPAPLTPKAVPGSVPTAGQRTGNLGLLNLERELGMASASARQAFADRRVQQNSAQLARLRNFAPADGQAEAAGNYFVGRLNAIDAAEEAAVNAARAKYEEHADKIGGDAHPADIGRNMADHVDEHFKPAVSRADRAITSLEKAIDQKTQPGRSNAEGESARQQYGAALRDTLESIRVDANKERAALYEARDPEGKLAIDAGPVVRAAKRLRGELNPQAGDHLTPREEDLIGLGEALPDVAPMRTVAAFRKNVNAALQEATAGKNVGTPGAAEAVRRLTILKQSVDNAEAEATERAARSEAPAIAANISPGETVAGRLAEHVAENGTRVGGDLEKDAALWYAERHGTNARAAGGQPGSGRDASRRSSGVSPVRGGQVPHEGRPGDAASHSGLQGEPRHENLTAEDADRFKAADAFNRDYQQRFGPKTATGEALARGPSGDFKMALSKVAANFWRRGPAGAESSQQLIRAMGSREAAEQAIGDYAQFDLRSYAQKEGGLDSAKLTSWLTAHRDAISEFSNLKRRFGTIKQAQEALDAIKAKRAEIEAQNPVKPGQTGADTLTQFIKPGVKGGEAVDAYLKNAGDTPAAHTALADGFAHMLRTGPMRDGEMTAKAYDAWRARYASALDRVPAVRAQFDTLADAQRAMEAASARAVQARNDYLTSAVRHYLTKGGEPIEPQAAVASILKSPTGPGDAAELVDHMRGDPAALKGPRMNFAEALAKRATNTGEAGTSGESEISIASLQNIVTDDRTMRVLRQIFPHDQVKDILQAVADDARLTARSHNATKIPGSPGTTADWNATHADDPHGEFAKVAGAELGGELLGHLVGLGPIMKILTKGAAIGGKIYYSAARAAGIHTERDLMAQALLHPEILRAVWRPRGNLLCGRA